MKILIINGPNLNLLGVRETDIYGTIAFEDHFRQLEEHFDNKAELTFFQSNHEGALIDHLQLADRNFDAVVLNPAGYTHTSIAIADTVRAIRCPVIEVHISNIFNREPFRQQTLTGASCLGCIFGLGLEGYRLAVQYLIDSQS